MERWFKNMSDLNVKLVSPADPRLYEQKTSSYLLNVEVLSHNLVAYPPKAVTLTDKDVQFLNDLKVTW